MCPETVQIEITHPVTGSTSIVTITFIGVSITNNTSTWCYNVEVEGEPALSHWNLGLCPDPFPSIIAATRNGQPVIYEPLSDGFTGIKFEEGVDQGDGIVEYCVTLEGIWAKEAVDIAVKGGPGDEIIRRNAICGPGCNHVTPPRMRRGYQFA
ncbi:MAG TPA: hypothetical protein DDZ66_01525 [Firmicutes bacterium]|jgi:hypothetical protein|nr:hypothetical protein [Bacillota bacterium]